MSSDPVDLPPKDDPAFDALLKRHAAAAPARPGASHDSAVMRAMDGAAARIRRRRQRRWQIPLALAATLVVGIGVVLNLPPSTEMDALRGGAVVAVTPPDQARLDAAPVELSWPAVGGANRYALKLRDEHGELIWEAETLTTPLAELPANVRSRMQLGGTFLWQVSADAPGGPVTVGEFWFEIRR